MANPAYLYNNYLTYGSVTIGIVDAGGSCIDSNFPVTNLQNPQVALTCRTDAKVAVKIQIDLGGTINTQRMRIWAILNHNFSGGTFDINSYTWSDYSTGKQTEASAVPVRLLDVYKYITNPYDRRYWEIDLTNATSDDSYFEIGYLMGRANWVTLTNMFDMRSGGGYEYKNIVNLTTHDVRWVHKIYKKRNSLQFKWERRKATYLPSELKTLYDTVYGDAYPFLFIPKNDETDCYYVYIANPKLLWTLLDIGTKFTEDITLELIEAVRGKS